MDPEDSMWNARFKALEQARPLDPRSLQVVNEVMNLANDYCKNLENQEVQDFCLALTQGSDIALRDMGLTTPEEAVSSKLFANISSAVGSDTDPAVDRLIANVVKMLGKGNISQHADEIVDVIVEDEPTREPNDDEALQDASEKESEDPESNLSPISLALDELEHDLEWCMKKKRELFRVLRKTEFEERPNVYKAFSVNDAIIITNFIFSIFGIRGATQLMTVVHDVYEGSWSVYADKLRSRQLYSMYKDDDCPELSSLFLHKAYAGDLSGKSSNAITELMENIHAAAYYESYLRIKAAKPGTRTYNAIRRKVPPSVNDKDMAKHFLASVTRKSVVGIGRELNVARIYARFVEWMPTSIFLLPLGSRTVLVNMGSRRMLGAIQVFKTVLSDYHAALSVIGQHLYPAFARATHEHPPELKVKSLALREVPEGGRPGPKHLSRLSLNVTCEYGA